MPAALGAADTEGGASDGSDGGGVGPSTDGVG